MTSLRRRTGTVAALAAVLALVVAGCSSDATTTPDSTTEPSGAAGAALPDDQQNLTYAINYGCTSLDPTENFDNCRMQVDSNVLQTLVALDDDSQPTPLLASSWEWTDETTLVFELRDDVTFSDGTPFTAQDVVATFDRYIEMQSVLATQLAVIDSYTADSDTTLTIRTKAPTGTLLGVLSMIFIGKADSAADDAYWAQPIGTGPFVVSEFVANDRVTLTRNDDYWGEPAKLKTLTFKQITDTNGKITALSNGSVHAVQGVPSDQIATVEGMSGVKLEQIPSFMYTFLWLQNSREPFTDPKVRQAMWAALDLETIVGSLLGETADTMTSLCPEAAFGCLPTSKAPGYDPELAKELLAEAGYPNGFTTSIDYSTANVGFDQIVSAMISYWKEVGITVEPKADDQATFLAAIAKPGQFDMIVNANLTTTGDADFTLNRLYTCAADRLGYCNPDLDALLAKGQQTTDADERRAIYQEISDILATDVPGIGLFQQNTNMATLDTVQGLTLVPSENIDWSTVYLTD